MAADPTALPPRPRTLIHPGPFTGIRIDHMGASRGRHFRLSLPRGRSLHQGIVEALHSAGVQSASMTLIDGELQDLGYCVGGPGIPDGPVAAYGPPLFERSVRFIVGNATFGKAADGAPVIHCHAVFRTHDGRVRGGHVLADKAIVGASSITVLATSLDGFELRISHDEETGMPLLRPHPQTHHA